MFGDISKAALTDKNPRIAFQKMKDSLKRNTAFPKIYMACGRQDPLFTVNEQFRDFLQENDADVTWKEETGEHNWDFWRAQIKEVLNWLPFEEAVSGLNSGNVRE